jgi:hypothetical protein
MMRVARARSSLTKRLVADREFSRKLSEKGADRRPAIDDASDCLSERAALAEAEIFSS